MFGSKPKCGVTIRAVVGEMMHRLPAHRTVYAVTTDGILTDAHPDEFDLSGPICQRFQALCELVEGPDADGQPVKMIEEKHRFRQGLVMRNRAYATLIPGDADQKVDAVMLAKGSISVPKECPDANAYIVDLYLQRQPGQKTMTRPFVSVREQWLQDKDVLRLERPTTMNLEYDFKRRPINPRMLPAGAGEHLAFDTVPWETMVQAEMVRSLFDHWRQKHCLKTIADFEDFEDLMLCTLTLAKLQRAGRRPLVNITAEGSVGVLKRMFLRAYTQGLLNSVKTHAYAQVAQTLSDWGYPTSTSEVKNAVRATFYESIVPRTPRAQRLMDRLVNEFSEMDAERLWAPPCV